MVPVRMSLAARRDFSTSPARRKQDDSEKEDGGDGKEGERRRPEDQSAETTVEAKSRREQPTPIPSDGGKGGGDNSTNDGNGNSGSRKRKVTTSRELAKPSIPDFYPEVLAIPIAQRPLFPGFYKAITIRDPNVIAAVQELLKRGQSYVGAFLLKDPESSSDVIRDANEVYDVGTFCQVTGAFPAGHGGERALQAVLYPHRRIRLTELMPPPPAPSTTPTKKGEAGVEEEQGERPETEERAGAVTASFEEAATTTGKEEEATAGPSHVSFLRGWPVSLVRTENLADEPFDKRSPTIRALISEIVNTCKEIGNVNHLFRDHVSAFAMSQSAANIADEPAKLADFAAAVSGGGEMEEAQGVLEALSIEQRLARALEVIKKEQMNAQLSSKISRDVENKIAKRQREYWLLEQMKGIRRELGLEADGKERLVARFREVCSFDFLSLFPLDGSALPP